MAEKPLPPPNPEDSMPAPPFDDPPLIGQRMPEEAAFVNAYDSVGQPRILVFVNRTLEGRLLPVNREAPSATVERRITSSGSTNYRETTEVYLHPYQYDESWASALDYQAVENILSDWMSAGGRVRMVSPIVARQRLSDQQVRDLQSGRPAVGARLRASWMRMC